MELFATLPILILLTGALVQLLVGHIESARLKGWLAFAAGLGALAAVVAGVPSIWQGQPLTAGPFLWDQGVPILYHVDGLSLIFALMATGIGAAILLYCVRYMEHEPQGVTRFYALMLVFIAGLVNLVASANLLLAYLSWEVVGLCSYFLVGFWYKSTAAANGARKVLLMTHLPGYGLLIAILLLYSQSGTFLWTDPALSAAFTAGIFGLMLLAAMAKSVMVPLHTWIPEAMNAPTPVSALLHSACYVKAGVYLIARIYAITPWQPSWNTVVLGVGCATMLVGALFALAQTDLKRLLAFSTISQLGYIITGLGLGTGLGVAAGLFYCLSHGLFKGTLFLCAGSVQHAAGTRDMRQLGGLAAKMPHTAKIWLVAAAAIIGVPLTNGFVAKWLLLDAALEAGAGLVVIVAWLVSVFTAFYMLKATVGVFYGELPAALAEKHVHEAAPSMLAGKGFLAGLALLFGIAPQLLMQPVVAPAVRDLGFEWQVGLSWLGVQTGSAGMQVTLGAAVVLLGLLAGWAVFRLTRAPKTHAIGLFTGGEPLAAAGDSVGVADFASLAETAFEPVFAATDPDPLYLKLWAGLKKLAGQFDNIFTPLGEGHPLLASLLLALVVLALVWVW